MQHRSNRIRADLCLLRAANKGIFYVNGSHSNWTHWVGDYWNFVTKCDLFDSMVVNYRDVNCFSTDLAHMQGLVIFTYMIKHLNTLAQNT